MLLAMMLFAGVLAACNNGSGDQRKEVSREALLKTKGRR